ncbi:hypothetical protein E2562_008857 [Oryza meyeriana var. granulata]|uniref:DNA-directed RNA polymerase n=1 Tax=Oryza meyeriana var. granulata TaxID=110450 RepID=A0A6G1D0F6_9ORYZ|nr:hypothetical protein E2562_008857 [Oryza meyeriana var. granulata]
MLKKLNPELINQVTPRWELLFLSCLPVTPNCHRVAEMPYGHSDGPRLAFLYSKKSDGESSTSTDTHGTKWLKDIILSKRSDNAFRSIMVGDPKVNLNEIGIPVDFALNLVVSEQVSSYNFKTINLKCNLHLLTKEVLLVRRNGKLIFIQKANQLEIGDIAYRLLQDGDLVLVNGPPSVHQHSLIALSAKLLPIHSAVSINPLCCDPFKGDFDGDCLHGYVPQSLQSRAELEELEVLKCHKGANSVDHTGLLFLSKHLRKYRYGFEYASLEVKDHLERVDFADLVDTVMILYGGSDMQKTQGNPWITHFHLSQETMKIKRLGLGFIVRELIDQYNALRKQLNNTIPSVCISNSKCSVGNECVKNQACCITMVVQVEPNSTSQLDIIKERVIPSILATLLKRFLEFKDVKVQCQQDSELVVKVVFEINNRCYWKEYPTTALTGCGRLPVCKWAIPWAKSRFKAAKDLRPAHSFINAAKRDSVDNLSGTLDAIAWGKEPCIGTSGSFKILYSGKSHETKQNENIYDFLHNPEVQAFEKNFMYTYGQRTGETSKQRSVLNSEGNATINGGAISVNQKFLDANVVHDELAVSTEVGNQLPTDAFLL